MKQRRNHFETAERAGREANLRGLPRTADPYADSKAQWISGSPLWFCGARNWIQTYYVSWNEGWDKAEREIEATASI